MSDWSHRMKKLVRRMPWLQALLRRTVVGPRLLRGLAGLRAKLPATVSADAPRVLVPALRPWGIHRGWEGALSRLLLQEDMAVTWAECSGAVSQCDAMLACHSEPSLCRYCTSFNHKGAAAIGVDRIKLSDLTPAAECPLTPQELASHVEASWQRSLGAGPTPESQRTASEIALQARYVRAAESIACLAGPLFDEVQPDALLALNGKFYAESILVREAQRRGIPVWTYERGNIRDTIVLSQRSTAVPFDTREIIEALPTSPLQPAERARIESYLEDRVALGNGQVRFQPKSSVDTRIAPAGRRVVSLFTNLVWDSGVVGEDTIFPDMFAWIEASIRAVSKLSATQLVIRVHPAEQKIYWHPTRDTVAAHLRKSFPAGLPEHVTFVDALDDVNSYDLVAQSERVLVYTSSIGMEAAAAGKPVIVAARSNYSDAPFVHRPDTPAAFQKLVQSDKVDPPPDSVELAYRYLYRLYFEEMLPVPWIAETPSGFDLVAEQSGNGAELVRARIRELRESARVTQRQVTT